MWPMSTTPLTLGLRQPGILQHILQALMAPVVAIGIMSCNWLRPCATSVTWTRTCLNWNHCCAPTTPGKLRPLACKKARAAGCNSDQEIKGAEIKKKLG